ncbi:hypothetical protein Patl1_15157 [Pistacia atlantica]|uniref:Uncharacterized protein n=1 Tax=Pistacia atlantica TaxID=434234 RepID=A0ACC1B6J2_9ROSI|nr:hypothetical protein Patl1_15157 [Pistacia atlantica]
MLQPWRELFTLFGIADPYGLMLGYDRWAYGLSHAVFVSFLWGN